MRDRDAEYEVIQCMRRNGGGFVQSLAECFARADAENFAILRIAFNGYWENYERMAKQQKEPN